MKVKHLLFSSIFLSMGFAACTNEVDEFAPQVPEKELAGVELDDVTINLTNSDFSADAETRALLNKVETKWIAEWEEGDAIGAAWFSKVKFDDEGKVTGTPVNVYNAFGNQYGSNAKFNWKGGVEFKADAVVMAGGYVLYHPYNAEITDDMSAIPVKPIESPQTFNCAPEHIADQISENITAANVVKFLKGGDQLTDFTIEQIPNLYGLSFRIEDENLLKLENKLQISRIYIEVTNGDKPAINTTGSIAPSSFAITADTYNDVEGTSLPEIVFNGDEDTRISRMQIDVTNEAKDANYQITALDKATSNFYFTMLPIKEFDKVTIKIVGKMGKTTKIFSRSYTETGDFAYSGWSQLYAGMTGNGGAIILPVKLNVAESVDDGIYDEAQFYEAWKAGQRTFNLATALNLVEAPKYVNFLNPEVKDAEGNVIADHVIFSGEKVTLPSINGKYSFNNEVEINGNATITRCGSCSVAYPHPAYGFNKSAHITQNLTVNSTGTGALNINGATTVDGNLVAEAGVNFTGKTTISGTATIKKGAYFATGSTIKGDVTVEGGKLTCKALTIEKNLTINEGAEVEVASDKFITVKGNVNANGVITGLSNSNVNIEGVLTANANVTIGEAKIKDVIANKPVTIASVTEMGNLTANAAVTIEGAVTEMGDVDANANVTIAGAVTKMGYLKTANGAAVSFGDAVTEMGDITAAENTTVTFTKAVKAADITTAVDALNFPAAATANDIIINKGTVTAKNTLTAKSIDVANKSAELFVTSNLKVEGKLTANGLVNAKSYTKTGISIGELVIADGITVTLNGKSATEKCVIGNLGINKEMTYFGTLVGDYIAVNGGVNEGTINVPNFTINAGTFAQKGTFTGAITVAENATLDVDANTNADVTNYGTVDVAAGVSIIGEVVNNNTIDLYGILNEDNGAITLNEGSVLNMAEKANLNLKGAKQMGEVKVCNGAIIAYSKKPSIVSYTWKTVAPKDYGASSIVDKINKYYLDNATLKGAIFNSGATIEAFGVITFNSNVNFDDTNNNITFVDNTKFTATKAYTVTLNDGNKVEAGKTLTIEKVVLDKGTITLGTNAKFVGEKNTTKVTY